MEAENVILERAEGVAAHQAEIGDIFLHFTAISDAIILSVAELDLDAAHTPIPSGAVPETRVAGAENRPKDAITGDFPLVTARAQSITMAMRAGCLCQRNCLCSIPIHLIETSSRRPFGAGQPTVKLDTNLSPGTKSSSIFRSIYGNYAGIICRLSTHLLLFGSVIVFMVHQ